ncbi:hypothetical protein JCM16358_08120 [Halanaerocella petrolearia]
MEIKGLANFIIERMVERSNHLSQGRAVGALGFVNQDGYIDAISELVDGGLSGLPQRMMLSKLVETEDESLLEALNQLPDNVVLIITNPGKTGIIVDTGGINIFGCPIVKIGVKMGQPAGVGIIHPREDYFELATQSEQIQLERLTAKTMDEEREVLRKMSQRRLKYLEICEELAAVELSERKFDLELSTQEEWQIPYTEINSLSQEFAQSLIQKSLEVERGREVAAIGEVRDGHVVQKGEIVVGGMGYVPSRMLASSYTDISGISLRDAYQNKIPHNVVIVHTHPGATGVMHMGDAMAGPGTWGRPIIAIGHDKEGDIKGATTIELLPKVAQLAKEYEKMGQQFYQAETPEEEARIRKRRFGIAQEYTDLCKAIEIK